MPIEEQAEERIQNAVQNIITGGARLVLKVPKSVFLALLRTGTKLAKTGVHGAAAAVRNTVDTGRMSEKRLQKKKGGDLHQLRLDDETMREVQRSLREAGIDYHLERTDDGQFFLHFAGKDEDHIRHAVRRAFEKMGLDVTAEDLTPDPQEKPVEKTRDTPGPTPEPQGETQERPAAEREDVSPSAAVERSQRGIDWHSVDPEIMELAANELASRHPSLLSWDRLMEGLPWNEEANREYVDKVLSWADSRLDLHEEFNTILHDDFGQGAQPPEKALEKTPEPAAEGERRGNDDARTAGHDRQTRTENDTRRDGNKEGEPKPIQSRKTLLDRFKTKLNENLAEQKNNKTPAPNRDRTPRKGR